MQKIIYVVLISLLFTACEDVIQVDLKSSKPKLVIDASLNWFKDTPGNIQLIQLTLSTDYFNTSIPAATGATVTVTDLNNNTFNFVEEDNTGIYRNQSFIPVINGTYNLNITYNNEVYEASEILTSVVPIEFVEQKDNGGFSGNETELKAYYNDPKNIKNYYLFEFINTGSKKVSLEVYDDKFTDGNQIFAFHSEEDVFAGDEFFIQNFGISNRYYEFMNILLQQSDDESGDPFQAQPATIRGNCINKTNPDNYPLGYFRASEVAVYRYIIN